MSEPFEDHRGLLFSVAYEILGSVADAEDVVQESWLRWSQVDPATIENPRAYLARIATRQALNRARTVARRRETYVGPWLPEPLETIPDVAEQAELAESVSTAMLLVLETLTPPERAVFVLHEVFALEYAEIADAIEKSPAAVRQLAHRAREHVAARRPRLIADKAQQARVTARFLQAVASGDLQSLMDVLAPDVVLITDGGGIRKAALRPIVGPDKVLRFLQAVAQPEYAVVPAEMNGGPAILVSLDGVVDSVVTWRIDEDRVTALYLLRNPEKLGGLGVPH